MIVIEAAIIGALWRLDAVLSDHEAAALGLAGLVLWFLVTRLTDWRHSGAH
jgi:NADPH:quinone reductase-like Zn-dependent oxidoreductase